MAPAEEATPAEMPDDAPQAGAAGTGSGSYVPPHLRGRGGAGEKMGGKFERDDLATLRVTNVSEFAEEQDLREMFSRYGHVTRVFLAKDRETGRAKGFAFVSYADRSDAAKACEKMDGCKYRSFHVLSTTTNNFQMVLVILFCASNSPRSLVTRGLCCSTGFAWRYRASWEGYSSRVNKSFMNVSSKLPILSLSS